MRFYRLLVQHRLLLTVILALIGIGLMIFYTICDTACSYLRGDLFGIDLKYVGVGYMLALIILAFLKQADIIRMLVAAGIGVEVFLVSFQISENVFCPFCLTFGVMVIFMYLINYQRSVMTNHWYQKLLYFFGDARIPFARRRPVPLLILMIIGYLFVTVSFSGSATPAYAAESSAVPSWGKGSWELIIFTDYFCPPCQTVEKDLEPELERLLVRGDIRITFVDYPGHKDTPLFAKYFLCAVAADQGNANMLKARKVLFELAAQKKAIAEKDLAASLKSRGIALKIIDPKPAYQEWTAMLKRFGINQTPTCILRFSSAYTRKYANSETIRLELIPELQKLFPKQKKD